MATDKKPDYFKGTAWYYARFRPQYPEELFTHVKEKFHLNGVGRLLDLGCGTGQLTLPLVRYFEEAVGMDPESDMLAEAAALAKRLGVKNVKWVEGGSGDLEKLGAQLGKFRLVTMGRSFHWMDREKTLQVLWEIIDWGGGVIVIDDNAIPDSMTNQWQKNVKAVIQRWLGEIRRAGSSIYVPPHERHEQIIARSQFKRMEIFKLNYQRSWTIDSIIGHLYSTSFASAYVLGDKREPFEKDLRKALLALQPSGEFKEDVCLEAILAWKERVVTYKATA